MSRGKGWCGWVELVVCWGLLVHPTVEHPQADEKETDLDEGPLAWILAKEDLVEGARPLTAL